MRPGTPVSSRRSVSASICRSGTKLGNVAAWSASKRARASSPTGQSCSFRPAPSIASSPRPATIDPLRDQTREQVTRHLEAARAAQRAGNRLRQLAEADLALRLAPRNKTARYLVGDALLGAGDRAGCKYLRQAGLAAARARADAAGCP